MAKTACAIDLVECCICLCRQSSARPRIGANAQRTSSNFAYYCHLAGTLHNECCQDSSEPPHNMSH